MNRRPSLSTQTFIAILAIAGTTALTVGYFARSALSSSFDAYLNTLPMPGTNGRPRMGRMMLGAAEQTFVTSVDRSVYISAAITIAAAALLALLIAMYLNRPLKQLRTAAEQLADGDLSHRVEVSGPEEVASIGIAFNRMADSLEEAETLRRRLVADVAHELRNPIAAARLQAEGMAEGVLALDRARLESMLEDLTHLSTLVDDLQELSVAEAGRLSYSMEPLDVVALAHSEVERASTLAHEGVAVSLAQGPSELIISADPRRISQVLRNLLSNAVRHTTTGSIEVSIEPDGDSVRVSVTDTGEGIPADELSHIFERFYRADAARAAHTGGSGLGLAISRTIVRDHGGRVFASSTVGTGTTVGFTLPLHSK